MNTNQDDRNTNQDDPRGRPGILELDLVHRWLTLPLAQSLPLTDGSACQLLYAGRPGGPQGPDIRDAVLQFVPEHVAAQEERIIGDVEFHIRCSDWYTHQHHTDARYNNVILHVVLIFDSVGPILRQDGQAIPICSLNDLVPAIFPQPLWPCQCIIPSLSAEERAALLQRAGLLRFEQKTQSLLALLREAHPHSPFSAYDVCLIPALVEALGYGRDRAFFRAIGQRLVGLASTVPEPSGHAATPSPLDAGRLRASGKLVEQWRATGAWETIRGAIEVDGGSLPGTTTHKDGGRPQGSPPYPSAVFALTMPGAIITRLRAIFSDVGAARADILVCNVVLPFAAAVAHVEQDHALLEQTQELYITFPELASNQVTRSMCKQLGLAREPKNACKQQGLHYIYGQTCREKHCDACIVVGREP